MTSAPSKSFTGRMRDAEKVVRARSDVSSTEFRVFTAVLSGLNESNGTFDCSDEVLAVLAGFKQRQSLSVARAGLQRKRIIWFRAGRPGRLTRYGLALLDQDIDDGLALLKDAKDEARAKIRRDGDRRVGVKDRLREKALEHAQAEAAGHGRRKETATPNSSSACGSVYAAASMDVYTVHPRHTPSLSSSTDEGLDSERTREVEQDAAHAYPDPTPSLRDQLIEALGAGNVQHGRLIADEIGPQRCAFLTELIQDVGAYRAGPQIRDAVADARARLNLPAITTQVTT